MKKVLVEYVGKKSVAHDNVAHSGKSWAGAGDVQEVTPEQAKQLLRYPDQWAAVDVAEVNEINIDKPIEVIDENGDTCAILPNDLKKPLEKLSKPELIAWAKATFGKDLDTSLPKKLMLDQIEEWAREIGV